MAKKKEIKKVISKEVKKCLKCGARLEGFIAKLFRIKPSVKKKGYCNKCEDKV